MAMFFWIAGESSAGRYRGCRRQRGPARRRRCRWRRGPVEIGRVGENELSVQMAVFDGGLGNGQRHGQYMAALNPGTGEELGQVGAGSEIAADHAAGSLGRAGVRHERNHPRGRRFVDVERNAVRRIERRSRRSRCRALSFTFSMRRRIAKVSAGLEPRSTTVVKPRLRNMSASWASSRSADFHSAMLHLGSVKCTWTFQKPR